MVGGVRYLVFSRARSDEECLDSFIRRKSYINWCAWDHAEEFGVVIGRVGGSGWA